MKTALIVALILLVVGALLAGSGWVLLQKYPIKQNVVKDTVYPFSGENLPNTIQITTVDSRVEILPIEGNEWRVECKETEDRNHTVELVDGVLTVRQNGDVRKWYEYVGILKSFQNPSVILYLPKQTYESLSIHSVSGSIKVQESFVFSNVSLQNTSGSILCNSRVEGDLDVKNTSGSIQISGGVCGELRVQNGSGSIKVKDATPTRATIQNISGSIDLVNVICQENCEIENTSGSIELERCDAAYFDLKTVSGSIKGSILSGKVFDCHSTSGGVHVPENSEGGTFKVRTTSGGIRITVVE
jgi:DUF4097 and DUF4098 domain-containing protein YvlB